MGLKDQDATLQGALFKATFEEGLGPRSYDLQHTIMKQSDLPTRSVKEDDFRLPPINT